MSETFRDPPGGAAAPSRRWNLAALQALLGESETTRLEFKSAKIMAKQDWLKQVTKEVSAFANTEGGDVIIGVEEQRQGKERLASALVGIELNPYSVRDRIIGNVRPLLLGITAYAVDLPESPDRHVIVVTVPKGNTAYQASDLLYYGRFDESSRPLQDNHVRLLMAQGRTASINVRVKIEVLDERAHKYSCTFVATNAGGVTIREGSVHVDKRDKYGRFGSSGGCVFEEPLHPGQSRVVHHFNHDGSFTMPGPGSTEELHGSSDPLRSGEPVVFEWVAFLPDSQPSTGFLDLAPLVREAREPTEHGL